MWAVPEDAVGCEPVSAPNSLRTGKLTGNLPISGVSAANLTTSLRACARPDRATWAACRRRRGDRVVFFCCDCSQPLLARLGLGPMAALALQSPPLHIPPATSSISLAFAARSALLGREQVQEPAWAGLPN